MQRVPFILARTTAVCSGTNNNYVRRWRSGHGRGDKGKSISRVIKYCRRKIGPRRFIGVVQPIAPRRGGRRCCAFAAAVLPILSEPRDRIEFAIASSSRSHRRCGENRGNEADNKGSDLRGQRNSTTFRTVFLYSSPRHAVRADVETKNPIRTRRYISSSRFDSDL